MLIYKPDYYDRFRCIASACPDSCCREWDVQVDEETARRYHALPGEFGDRVRQALRREDGETIIAMKDGRCPLWREDGLCQIQLALGEAALCKVCREFPRLTHDYGNFMELGLELSCPEAARMILSAPPAQFLCQTCPGGEAGDYDHEAMAVLRDTRDRALALLSDGARPINESLALILLYGYEAQSQLDGGEAVPFDPEKALEEGRALAKKSDMVDFFRFFSDLEILTPQWEGLLRSPVEGHWESGHLALARYFTERYWLQAVSDYDLSARVKFLIIACLLIKHLPGELLRNAQLFSKEIENDCDNVDAILDGAYTHPAFRDDRLLGLLLC